MKQSLLAGIVLLLWQTNVFAQEPKVDQPCPDFLLNKIDFYKTSKVSLSDLKGKWVIFHHWSIGCSGCIASIPPLNRMQKEFGDKVQFIMIAPDRPQDREYYSKLHKRADLVMPSAFDDKLFNESFTIIDPNGIVRVVTNSSVEKQKDKLVALMEGSDPGFASPKVANKFNYDYHKPYLVDGNGGIDSNFIFRSLLAKWTPDQPFHFVTVEGVRRQAIHVKSRFVAFDQLGLSIPELYRTAYFDRINVKDPGDTDYDASLFQTPVFEIKNKGVLTPNEATGENKFSYSLTLPIDKCTDNFVLDLMRSDLKHYFGYEVTIEKRKMPYWKLIARPGAKDQLKAQANPKLPVTPPNKDPWAWRDFISLRNYPMKKFLTAIKNQMHEDDGAPYVDETGIDTNIDVNLELAYGDPEVTIKALQKVGLDLVRGEKEMKVILVRNAKN